MKRIGQMKHMLTRERIMLIIEELTKKSRQNRWSNQGRNEWLSFLNKYEHNVELIYNELKYQSWEPSKFRTFTKMERGKLRVIFVSPPKEQIIDLLLSDILKEVFMVRKRLIHPNAYGSIECKGQHEMRSKIFKSIKGRQMYVLSMDVRKFYPSLDHQRMMYHCERHIKCKWLLWLIEKTLSRSDTGLALGLASSNILGHVYLSEIDWTVTKRYGARMYYRFCDDIYIVHHQSNYLHTLSREIQRMVNENKQQIKHNWVVVNVAKEPVKCLGGSLTNKRARLLTAGRKRAEALLKKEIEGDDIIRSWAGASGSFNGLQIDNLLKFWNNEYREFFERLQLARAANASMREYRRRYAKMEILLRQAKDCRSEANRRRYPIDL